jgi:hypothetical protein
MSGARLLVQYIAHCWPCIYQGGVIPISLKVGNVCSTV